MLAGAGDGDAGGGFRPGILFGFPLVVHQLPDQVFVGIGLVFVGPEAGYHAAPGAAQFVAVLHHLHQGIVNGSGYLAALGAVYHTELRQLHFVTLGDVVPGVGHQDFAAIGGEEPFYTVDLLLATGHRAVLPEVPGLTLHLLPAGDGETGIAQPVALAVQVLPAGGVGAVFL